MNERNLVPGGANPVSLPMAAEDKKAYRSPRLVEYGDFHRLTQAAASNPSGGSEDASLGATTGT